MDKTKKYETVFGSWKVGKLLGKGSFGSVYEITREEFGNTYRAALKIISIPQEDEDIKSRMLEGTDPESVSAYYDGVLREIVNENEIMSQLKGNSNIVSYEDHMIIPHEDGIGHDILIKMELLTPLVDYMLEHTLDEKDVIRLGIDMCRALELCHNKSIIHRDIKPQNIFLSDNGNFKLGDFGIARTIEKTTGGLSKKGTYKYMAPEVYRGDEYGTTVDLYSLGMVMYTLLNNNRSPFLPQPPEKISHNIEEESRARRLRGEPVPAPVNASSALSQIILKACSFYPQDRFRTAAEMRQALEYLYEDYDARMDETVQMIPGFNPAPGIDQMSDTGRIPPYGAQQAYAYQDQYGHPGASAGPQYVGQPSYRQTGSYGPVDTQSGRNHYGYGQAPGYTDQNGQVFGGTQNGYYPAAGGMKGQNGFEQPVHVESKKSRLPIIAAVIIGLLFIGAGIFVLITQPGMNNADLSALMKEPVFTGYDGFGVVSEKPVLDEAKVNAFLDKIKDETERENTIQVLETVKYKCEPDKSLENDDTVIIHASFDSDLAESLDVTVKSIEDEVTVSGLAELPEYVKSRGNIKMFKGHLYEVVDESLYWSKAKKACEEKGGHLATITNRKEQDFVANLIEEQGNKKNYWLGASDHEHEDEWKWITGETWDYANWRIRQPDNRDGDNKDHDQDYLQISCASYDPDRYMLWWDMCDSGISDPYKGPPNYKDTDYSGYICEWDGINETE